MWAELEGKGAQVPFSTSRTPQIRATRGGRGPCCAAWEAGAGVSQGLQDGLEATWRSECSFNHCVYPSFH